jgi:hypothetical protein
MPLTHIKAACRHHSWLVTMHCTLATLCASFLAGHHALHVSNTLCIILGWSPCTARWQHSVPHSWLVTMHCTLATLCASFLAGHHALHVGNDMCISHACNVASTAALSPRNTLPPFNLALPSCCPVLCRSTLLPMCTAQPAETLPQEPYKRNNTKSTP